MRSILLLGALALLASACEEKSELTSPTPKVGQPSKQEPKKVEPTKPATPSAPVSAAGREKVEVEMMGRVLVPKKLQPKKPKQILLYVADKDCLDEKAKLFSATRVSENGNFFSEVFPPKGTDLSLCAAFDEGEGQPARAYGKLGRTLHAVGIGEVVFSNLEITLAVGKPHVFPTKP